MSINITNKIYTVRGQKVMLDFDLAEIYRYTTSAFNQQIKNNIERFDGDDFMFQLSIQELEKISMSNFLISIQKKGIRGGRSKPVNAFTEQGIYMLMTVLKGELAIKQSRTLIRLFKNMKDYIIENQAIIPRDDALWLANRISENTQDIFEIKSDVKNIKTELATMIKKSEISPILLDFAKTKETREFLIMNGEVGKAKDTIINLYNSAKK